MPASGALAITTSRPVSTAALSAATACASECTTMTGAPAFTALCRTAGVSPAQMRPGRPRSILEPRGSPHRHLLEVLGQRQALALIRGANRAPIQFLGPGDQRLVDH